MTWEMYIEGKNGKKEKVKLEGVSIQKKIPSSRKMEKDVLKKYKPELEMIWGLHNEYSKDKRKNFKKPETLPQKVLTHLSKYVKRENPEDII